MPGITSAQLQTIVLGTSGDFLATLAPDTKAAALEALVAAIGKLSALSFCSIDKNKLKANDRSSFIPAYIAFAIGLIISIFLSVCFSLPPDIVILADQG